MRQIVAFLLLATASATGLASGNDPNIGLEYLPQETVSAPSAHVSADLARQPVRIRLEEARGADPARLGTRTDDDDRLYELRTDDDVVAYVRSVMEENFDRWNISVDERADLELRGRLEELEITERNMAVGASYKADVRVEFVLADDDRILWKGTGWADVSRYGRKFSNENCNEVLSDAMTEAFAALFDDVGFRAAWSGNDAQRPVATVAAAAVEGDVPPTAVAGESMSPDDLLMQIMKLMDEGFENATLVDYVDQQILGSRLSSRDLVAWKEADVPEKVIRAALNIPVR